VINKLGIIFLLLLLAAPFMVADYLWGSKFVGEFLRNQSLQIMGTILALNIATASFLVGHLLDIEMKAGKSIFDDTIRELKHNIYFMLALFILQMISLTLSDAATFVAYKYWIMGFSLMLFFAYLFCLYEITATIFSLRKFINKTN